MIAPLLFNAFVVVVMIIGGLTRFVADEDTMDALVRLRIEEEVGITRDSKDRKSMR